MVALFHWRAPRKGVAGWGGTPGLVYVRLRSRRVPGDLGAWGVILHEAAQEEDLERFGESAPAVVRRKLVPVYVSDVDGR